MKHTKTLTIVGNAWQAYVCTWQDGPGVVTCERSYAVVPSRLAVVAADEGYAVIYHPVAPPKGVMP